MKIARKNINVQTKVKRPSDSNLNYSHFNRYIIYLILIAKRHNLENNLTRDIKPQDPQSLYNENNVISCRSESVDSLNDMAER